MSKKDNVMPSLKVSGRTVAIIMVLALILGVILTFASVYVNGSDSKTASMIGLLEVYPAGNYTGPTQYLANYNVSLVANSGVGTLSLTKINGTTDPVTLKNYTISDFVVGPYNLNMTLSGISMSLGWINNSTIWTGVNASYVAASGPSAPSDQIAGSTNQTAFGGLSSSDYILLSLTITAQPLNTIPFMIAPVVEGARGA